MYSVAKLLRSGTVAAALLAGMAHPASATIYTVTYTGVMTVGVDQEGLFGPINGDLVGKSVKAVYTVDTTKGQHQLGSNFQQYSGGGNDFPAPTVSPVTAVFTVGGVSLALDSSAWGLDYRRNAPHNDAFSDSAEDYLGPANSMRELVAYVLPPGDDVITTSDPAAPLSYHLTSAATSFGTFFDEAYDPTNGFYDLENLVWQTTDIAVKDVGGIPSVPEPATGALIIAGLFGLGVLKRARSQRFAC